MGTVEGDSFKAQLRTRMLFERAALSAQERSACDARIADLVQDLPEYAAARVLMTYLSFGEEIDTRVIIERAWSAGKTVALPRCIPKSRSMEWYAVSSFEGLVTSRFGVDEPNPDVHERIDVDETDALALVPGLAFDDRGYRIGYGGGFYDVFLSRFTGVSVGLCRQAQRLRSLDGIESFDVPVRVIVTDQDVVRA